MGIIYNGPGMRNRKTDSFNNYNHKISIGIKGASSTRFPKKSFGFETIDVNNNEKDVSLLDLPVDND